MKNFYPLLIIYLLVCSKSYAQKFDSTKAISVIQEFQTELNEDYKDPEKSPLGPEDLKNFKAHDFFPIDLKYRVIAKLKTTPKESFFELRTTSGKTKLYRKYGEITFIIDGKKI